MTTPADNLFSDPLVQVLQKLLDDVQNGEILLPRFQRHFAWGKRRRLELFDSVLRGIPIGSLLIWETRVLHEDARMMFKTELGPFKLPKVREKTTRRYLLDGEQRLMTLFFALYRAAPRDDKGAAEEEPADAFEVFFDLEKQLFLTRADLDDGPGPQHFPLHDVYVPRGVLSFQRRMALSLEGSLGAEASPEDRAVVDKKVSDYIERSDTVTEAVRRYKAPVTVLSTDNLALVVETFTRVNSAGVLTSEAHMMNAISWTSSFDLLEGFDDIRQSIEGHPLWQGEANLSNEVLLRVAKRILGWDVADERADEIATSLRERGVLPRVGESLKRCADFLAQRGLRNPDHVPYTTQLVILGRVFDAVAEPPADALDMLERWLWFTSYTDVFARVVQGSVYQRLEEQALAIARGDRLRAPPRTPTRKPLPRFGFRFARARALAWMFAQRMMPHDGGDAADALAAGGSDALLRLVAPPEPREVANRAALRVLCRPERLDDIRAQIRAGTVDPGFRSAQVLSVAALDELRKQPRDVASFATIRERELNELEDKHFREILGRLFSGSAPADVGDEG